MRMPMTAAGDAAPASGQPDPPAGRLARLRQQARQVPALARQHWLFTVLLTAGLVLRILTQIAYRPALLYIDSTKYLLNAYPGDDPPGYQLALKPVLALGNLDLIAVLQHLLGLGMAVAIYMLLLRRGVPRWLAALATAPVLLDAYQLQIEQNVMPDVMFEALIVAGVVALLWRATPSPWLVVVAGLALGTSATARQIGEIFILPAVGYLLIVTPGWRLRAKHAGLLCLAFVLPILAASYRNYADPQLHSFSLAPYATGSIYGRMAEAANCATLRLPGYEKPLCPDATQKLLLGPDGLDHNPRSPIRGTWIPSLSTADYQALKQLCPKSEQVTVGTQVQYRVVASMCGRVTSDFDHRVLKQQPLRVLTSIGKDTLKLFALGRTTSTGDPSITPLAVPGALPPVPAVHRHQPRGVRLRHVQSQRGRGADRHRVRLPRREPRRDRAAGLASCADTSSTAVTPRARCSRSPCSPGWPGASPRCAAGPALRSVPPPSPACCSSSPACWRCCRPTCSSSTGATSFPPSSRCRPRRRWRSRCCCAAAHRPRPGVRWSLTHSNPATDATMTRPSGTRITSGTQARASSRRTLAAMAPMMRVARTPRLRAMPSGLLPVTSPATRAVRVLVR